jgi:hypothetical protein
MLTRMHYRGGLGRERGSSVVEMAIMSPILVAMVLWLIYFWENQQARLKAAEAARYIAFNQTVGATNDVPARFEDLDSSTAVGKLASARFNKLTIKQATQTLVTSPMADPQGAQKPPGLSGMASTIFGAISGAMGNASGQVMGFFGLDLNDGRVKTSTEFFMKNMLVPKKIGTYLSGEDGSSFQLDLSFKDSMTLDYKTFAAVSPAAWSGSSNVAYDPVSNSTTAVVQKMAFLTIADRFSGLFGIVEGLLSLFGIKDFPFAQDYISDSTRIQSPTQNFRYGVSDGNSGKPAWAGLVRTAPGDKYYSFYWKGNPPFDQWCSSAQGRACEPNQIRKLRDRDNPDYRSYNCRGPYYLGTVRSQWSEVEYGSNERQAFKFNSTSACQ